MITNFFLKNKFYKFFIIFFSFIFLNKIAYSYSSQDSDFEVFCKLNIDAKTVFVGQPIILSAKVYSRGNILQIGMENIKLPGFVFKEIQHVNKYQEELEGKNYTVLEKKFLLLSQEPGKIKIDPVVINFNVPMKRKSRHGFLDEDFFGALPVIFGENYQQKRVLSNNLQIDVLPLPEYPGLVDGVGDFKYFKAYTDKNEVFVNEPILFNLQIEGKGNLDQVIAPKLNLPSNFRFYESKTGVEQDLTTNFLGGKKRFEYVLQVPQKGEYQIPAQKFTYFDTQSKSYKTLKTSSLNLNIKDSGQIKDQENNNKSEIKEKNNSNKNNLESKQDINFIEENTQNFSENQKSFFLKIFENLNSVKLPGIFFLILLFLPILFLFKKYLRPVKNIANKIILNKFKTTKTSSKLLKNLEEIIEKKQAEKLYQFFLKYLSVKFDLQENNLNQDLIYEKILLLGWSQDKVDNFLNYLDNCAGIAFASKLKTGQINVENEKLLDKSKYWFFYLESENNKKISKG